MSGERESVREAVYAELARDHIQTGAEYMVMKRDARWKIVYYLGESHGELYDMLNDPGELCNLWSSPELASMKETMIKDLLVWSLRSTLAGRQQETPKPQQPMLI
ncbi:MAG: hypothetical protein IPG42_11575 [Betaproteobacteria bacterium]|nr:hypothetical protein [Betaproteobacteria bacterium]